MIVPPYPKREPFFSHKFVRILHKSCAAQEIGSTACYLLCIIAHTEDAAKYSGPVRFWNGQLIETMGFKSPKQLTAARDAAIKSGWLHYHRDTNRSVGKYFVAIPVQFSRLDDCAINPVNHSENGIIPESEILPGTVPNSERIRDERRNEFFLQSGKPSNPIPIPKPKKRAQVFDPLSLDLPENLKTERFQQSWNDWIKHRKEIRKPLKETQTRKMLEDFSSWGADRSVLAIDHTIKKGWQGIREPDSKESQSAPNDAEPPHIREKRLLEERRAKQRQEAEAVA